MVLWRMVFRRSLEDSTLVRMPCVGFLDAHDAAEQVEVAELDIAFGVAGPAGAAEAIVLPAAAAAVERYPRQAPLKWSCSLDRRHSCTTRPSSV